MTLRVDQGFAENYPMSTPQPRTHNPQGDTGKEVVYDQTKQIYEGPYYTGLEVNPYQHVISYEASEKHLLSNDTKASRWSRKKKMVFLWTGGILVVLIIIVIAVVLATTLPKKKGGPAKDSPDDSQPSVNRTVNAIVAKSSLAATAWITDPKSGSYLLRLIHQDTDGQLQSSTFNSSSGKWVNINDFMIAAVGSPLALTCFNQSIYSQPASQMQQELFFLDDKGKGELREWNWYSSEPSVSSAGAPGLASSHHFPVHSSSQIGAYWPFIIYQNSTGDLMEIVYGNDWNVQPTKREDSIVPVLEGSAIQIVPVQQALMKMGIFYQQGDLSMVLYERDGDDKNGRAGMYIKDATFTTPPLPPKTALAVFSIPGDDEAKYSPLKTYTLYQDSDAKIQMMWRNDTSSGWNGPKTFSAFEGADNGTSLACVTMFSFLERSMEKWSVPRCFFTVGGNITQVKMMDEDWEVVGIVGVNER